MKRLFITMICGAGLLITAACGGGNGNATSESADKIAAEDVLKELKTGILGDPTMEAAQAAFAKIGLSVDKVAPEYNYIKEDSIKAFRGVLYQARYEGTAIFVKEDMTDVSRDEFEAYVRKIYALTQEIADDNKVVYGHEKAGDVNKADDEWSVDKILAQTILGFKMDAYDWGFKQKGVYKRMCVELIDANKKFPARLKINFYDALQKSFEETMSDAEKALEDPEVQITIKEYLGE